MDQIVECLYAVTLTGCCVQDIPQQMNGSDCGMFACKFAEYVTRDARITFSQVSDVPFAYFYARFSVL